MSTAGRSNGLPAARYTPLVDLEPQLADALLEALRDEGVAAYAAPSPGVRGPYLDIRLPDGPTDRVWVDAASRPLARQVLNARMPEFTEALAEDATTGRPLRDLRPAVDDPNDTDSAWAAIVAGYELTAPEPVPRWPVEEDVDATAGPTARPAAATDTDPDTDPEPGDPPAAPEPNGRDWPTAAAAYRAAATGPSADPVEEPADEEDEHYVPPPPPPLPRTDLATKVGWLGVLGGPLFLLISSMTGWTPVVGAGLVALLAFIGGFVLLVSRMKDDGGDDDFDDGAVV
jgi:hypothetical protein